jgi:hypothetical protein
MNDYFRVFYPIAGGSPSVGMQDLSERLAAQKDTCDFLLFRTISGNRAYMVIALDKLRIAAEAFPPQSEARLAYQAIRNGAYPRCERCGCIFPPLHGPGYRSMDGIVSKAAECSFCELLSNETVISTSEHRRTGGTPAAIAYQESALFQKRGSL